MPLTSRLRGLRSNDSALRILDENRRTSHEVVAEALQTPLGSHDLHEEALGLDSWQMEGLERALSLPPHGFLTVEGPPGTGKTPIIAAAAREIATAGGQVLTTSLTNVAVDNAMDPRTLRI